MPIRLLAPPAGCSPGHSTYPPHRLRLLPSPGTAFTRRAAFRLAGGGALGALALGASTACGEEPLQAPDPLAAQVSSAKADAAAATAAIALAPQKQSALTAIAAERTAHAEALQAEIDRVIGVYGDGTTPVPRTRAAATPSGAAAPGGTTGTQAPPAAPMSLEQLGEQLGRSRQAAAELARALSGYRAGLLASISASCATEVGVLLA
ncbi:hypothetical protein [Nocardia goodfellowii]|uniref:Uncharacterized protein n=1 Tax=Nocardia goodfellowii TaxID=882446 RepID=A0ABS4QF14_9NOCA|nr:hypothetical protein [Nocardia goodfellowii]MBP2190257.1 hypothetical protein [Nocardia goodfellowii]